MKDKIDPGIVSAKKPVGTVLNIKTDSLRSDTDEIQDEQKESINRNCFDALKRFRSGRHSSELWELERVPASSFWD